MISDRDDANRMLEVERNRIAELENFLKQLEVQERDRCVTCSFVSLLVKLSRFLQREAVWECVR